jgi:hypothetical protein
MEVSSAPARTSWQLTPSEIAGQRLYHLAQASADRKAAQRNEDLFTKTPSISGRSRTLAAERFHSLQQAHEVTASPEEGAGGRNYGILLYEYVWTGNVIGHVC